MKKNVVVLDFDGLFSYPDFKSRILEPLVERDREFLVWTFNVEERVRQKIARMGLPDLAREVRIIDTYRYDWLLEALIEVQEGFRPIDDGEFIRNLLQDQSIPSTQESVERALQVYQGLGQFDVDERIYKIPPFLGEDNYLLIESDRAFGTTDLTRPDPTKEFEFAARGGYSLVMVPEHPDTWWELIDPPVDASPEQVMDVLAPLVLDWSGEPIRRDLAVDLGIFQAVEGNSQERIGRPMERF